jgi:Ca2+-binding RTX toxin-like protein
MATNNLNHSGLDKLLDQFVSSATETTISQALVRGRSWAGQHGVIGVEVESQDGSYTIPGSDQLFLDSASSGSMTVTSDYGHKVIAAGDGANSIVDQGPGGDTLVGGAGAATLQVTQGNNVLIAGAGLNTLMGGAGHDLLIGGGASSLEAGSGGSTLIGGLPPKHAHADEHEAGVNSNGQTWKTVPMDTLMGGSGNDLIKVYTGDNAIYAGTGVDTIYAGNGSDTIYGSTLASATNAMDTIYLGRGDTSVQGGAAGAATIFAGMHGNDTIIGSTNGQTLDLYSKQSSNNVKFTNVSGGITTITFKDHQSLSLENVTIHFSNGGMLKF